MAPKMGYDFKNKPLIVSNTNSYCLQYTSKLAARFKTLHAIHWAETRGYVITSTKITLLHLTKNVIGIFGGRC